LAGTGAIYRGVGDNHSIFLVVCTRMSKAEVTEMRLKNKLLSFVAAVAVCAAGFLLLDYVLMNLQGLGLIFQR
jgi:hypothetical protein